MDKNNNSFVFLCPQCGSEGTRNGYRESGVRRLKCTNKECSRQRFTEHTALNSSDVTDYGGTKEDFSEVASNFDDSLSKKRRAQINKTKRQGGEKTFLVTAAQNATPIFEEGWKSLLNCAKEHNAEIICIPYRYKNPTSLWPESQQNAQWWDEKLIPYLTWDRIQLNENLIIMGDIRITPTAKNPLTGLESITRDQSGIFAHTKVQLKMVPTPQNVIPKIITTTGAITQPNYTDTKMGAEGEYHHMLGATIVKVKNNKFFLRQIVMEKDGSFIDLDREYTPKGSRKAPRARAVVLGDTHVQRSDPNAVKATFEGKDSIVQRLKPEFIVHHDFVDFESRSPHEPQSKFFRNYEKHKQNRDDVEKEIKESMEFLNKYSFPWAQNVIVPSNHSPDHFIRWLDTGQDPRHDPKNAKFFFDTMSAILKEDGTFEDPIKYWASQWLKSYSKTVFLDRGDSFMVGGKDGVEVGFHGDLGVHGSRGNIAQFSKIGVRNVIGHNHTPGRKMGSLQVGTMSLLDMGYNRGNLSGWIHCHAVIYGNNSSKGTLLFIIGDEW